VSLPEFRLANAVENVLKYRYSARRTDLSELVVSVQYDTELRTFFSEHAHLPTHHQRHRPFMPIIDLDSEGY